MRGYARYDDEDLNEYEDEGEEDVYEEEYEEEEPPKPTKEELEYLELRQRLKESFRKKNKKENGLYFSKLQDKRLKPPNDDYGSFFGPSQPVIAQRVIEESKSFLETQYLVPKKQNAHHVNKTMSTSMGGPKTGVHEKQPRVNELKIEVQKRRDTRDYSFLLSDNAEPSVPTKEPRQKTTVSTADFRASQTSPQGRQLNNGGRQTLSSCQQRKSVPKNLQKQSKAMPHNSIPAKMSNSASARPKLQSLDPRKQLASNNGSGPGRPTGPKSFHSKTPLSNREKAAVGSMKKPMSPVDRQTAAKLASSIPKQNFQQRRESQVSKIVKMQPKQPMTSSKPAMSRPLNQTTSRPSLQQQEDKKKPVRPRYKSDDEDDPRQAFSMLRKFLGYNPNKYKDEFSDEDDDMGMEANFADIQREEKRSAKIARREDEEELRKIEEEEKRERMRKIDRKRKMSQR